MEINNFLDNLLEEIKSNNNLNIDTPYIHNEKIEKFILEINDREKYSVSETFNRIWDDEIELNRTVNPKSVMDRQQFPKIVAKDGTEYMFYSSIPLRPDNPNKFFKIYITDLIRYKFRNEDWVRIEIFRNENNLIRHYIINLPLIDLENELHI